MTADHAAEFEELMALLDGQLPPDAAERVRAHVDTCTDCQQMATEFGAVSQRMQAWDVGRPPVTLQPRRPTSMFGRRGSWMATAAVAVLATGGIVWIGQQRNRPPSVHAAAPISESLEHGTPAAASPKSAMRTGTETPQSQANRPTTMVLGGPAEQAKPARAVVGPLVIRTASLSLLVRDYDAARTELDRIARAVGGFVGNLAASGSRGGAPSLSATLRVPAPRLDETLTALKGLGTLQHERQGSDDVTQQSADLDARLANARASEARLADILKNRTGRLSDVLEVEREIARVRGEIEQMEAERKTMDNRIAYATVDIEMSTERKAEGLTGPASISTRLRNAVLDGFAAALEHAVSLAVFAAESLPTVFLWLVILAPPAWFVRRRRLGRV